MEMHDAARAALITIVQTHGSSLVEDERTMHGLLLDQPGLARGEIAVLVNAVREGIPRDLASISQSGVPVEVRIPQLAQRLEANYMHNAEAARWAVETWAIALGLWSPPVDEELPPSPPEPEPAPPPLPPPGPVISRVLPGTKTPVWQRMPVVLGGVGALIFVVGGAAIALLLSGPKPPPPPTSTPTTLVVAPPTEPPTPVPTPTVVIVFTLESSPDGAGILVDGESAGLTPSRLALKPGEHEVTLEKNTYQPYTQRIVLDVGQPFTIPVVELTPRPAIEVVNKTGKALGKDPFVDSNGLVRIASPTDEILLSENIYAVVYVAPFSYGIRDLALNPVWKLDRPGGQPPATTGEPTKILSSWQQTFLRVCIPGSVADARASNQTVTLTLLVDDEPLETFTFRVRPGPPVAPQQCQADIPSQQSPRVGT